MENIKLGSSSKTIGRPQRTPDTRRPAAAGGPGSGVMTASRACAREHPHAGFGGSLLSEDRPTMPDLTVPGRPAPPKKTRMPDVQSVVDPSEHTVKVTLTEPPGGLQEFGGSSDWPEFNRTLLRATLATVTVPAGAADEAAQRVAFACAGLAAFKPTDEIEGMIAAQAVGLHQAAMMCLGRAMLPGQPFEIASKLRRDAANMARAMADMLDLMDRKRGKVGQQVVRIERVTVNEGGQAIVGNVAPAPGTPGGRGRGEGG